MYNTRKLESEGVHGLLEGFNRNSRPQAAVAKVYTHGKTTKNSVELLYHYFTWIVQTE